MPIFGRRQLQQMFDELGPWLIPNKAKDLLNRLESVEPNQALPAEYELALTWAVSKIASLEIDKPVANRALDIYSPDLLPNTPLIADVAAVDDVSLSGIATMRRARNIINQTCNQIRKQSSAHLHYTFAEKSGYHRSSKGKTKYYRHRLVSKAFQMDERFRAALEQWMEADRPEQPLVWRGEHISVSILWRDLAHPFGSIFCTMPSLAHDLRDNPLYRVLKAKSRQLRDVPAGNSRAILLGNAGCRLLDEMHSLRAGLDTFSGAQIIERFLVDDPSIALVVVFSVERAKRHSIDRFNNPRVWRSYLFHSGKTLPVEAIARLKLLTERLPAPHLTGYEAHSWHEQGMCGPSGRGQYLDTNMSFDREKTSICISARALQELMAGILSPEVFQSHLFGNDNPVRRELAAGRTLADVRLEPKGADEDDDCLVLDFRADPAASPLTLPPQLKEN